MKVLGLGVLFCSLAFGEAVFDLSDGPVSPGTAANRSQLQACQFSSTLPSFTNKQQGALQCDSSGRMLAVTSPSVVTPVSSKYNATIQTFPDGTRTDLQSDVNGWTVVSHRDRNVTQSITTACASGVSCATSSFAWIRTDGLTTVGFETDSPGAQWVGTMITELSYDPTCWTSPGAAEWYSTPSLDTDSDRAQFINSWGNANDGDSWLMPVAGSQCMRVRASAITNTADVNLDAAVGSSVVWSVVDGNIQSGVADSGNPVKIGAKYNATIPAFSDGNRADLQADKNGRLLVSNNGVATYSSATANFALPLLATDSCVLGGSATKTVRVTRMSVACTQGTSGIVNIFLAKRSTADSGGTSTSNTVVPNDSNFAAGTATFLNYTANPSLGSLVGNVRAIKYSAPATNINTVAGEVTAAQFFGDKTGEPIVLNGTAQQLAINFNGVTIATGACTCYAEWTEQ